MSLSKEPLALKKYLENNTLLDTISNGGFVSTIQKYNGKILERVFAIRKRGKKKQFQEVMRRAENKVQYRNIYCGTMCGWKAVWPNQNSRTSWYYCGDWTETWSELKNGEDFNLWSRPLFELEDVIRIDPSLKYCCWNDKSVPIMKYIRQYRKNPQLEMLSKLGLTRYWYSKMLLKEMESKTFCKFLYKNSNLLYTGQLNVVQFIAMYKKHETVGELLHKQELTRYFEPYNYQISRIKSLNKDTLKDYLEKNNISKENYFDMISAMQKLEIDLTDTKRIYPNDFKYWHDYYTEQITIMENKETDDKIKAEANKYKDFLKTYDDITMLYPTGTVDFIKEGKELHHCVGRMGYNEKMAEGKSLIIFIRHKEEIDKPFLTLELEPNKKKILQFYGDHDNTPPKEVDDLIRNVWLKDIKKIRLKNIAV